MAPPKLVAHLAKRFCRRQLPAAARAAGLDIILKDLSANPIAAFPIALKPRWSLLKWSEQYRSSIGTLSWESGWAQRGIVVKFHRAPTTEEAARLSDVEYRSLSQAHALFGAHPCLAVAEPYRHYAAQAAVVMANCQGTTLTRFLSHRTRLWPSTMDRSACEEAVRQCARWLAAFHGLKRFDEPENLRAWCETSAIERIQDEMKRLPPQALSAETICRLRARCDRALATVAWKHAPVGLVHNDFGCHNILVDNGRITVLDLADSGWAFVYEDLCRFSLELELFSVSSLLTWDRSFSSHLTKAFRDEYHVDLDEQVEWVFAVKATAAFLRWILEFQRLGYHQSWHKRALRYLKQRLQEEANTD